MSLPVMSPLPGSRLVRFVGDRVAIRLVGTGVRAVVRTTIGRPGRTDTWRDVPMRRDGDGWLLELTLTTVGWFVAKAYVVDASGQQLWPEGADVGLSVHPSAHRCGNTIYCAFPRMFGATKSLATTRDALRDAQVAVLDGHGWTVIPPSGTLRDLQAELPHIAGRLGCRVLHLLPVTPTPTTFARFGRFGSPYAAQDLTAIDPALAVFDRSSTATEQFCALTAAAHGHGMRVLLDVPLNHTGWGSRLQEQHPAWFRRNPDGTFHSPGAWGTTWEDLVELDQELPAVWDAFADALRTWCARGVDGFRCDAGYMVPPAAWRHVIGRVRQTYPETIFLLEGLGGSWEITADLLGAGGMQWAYSELFQNHEPRAVAAYLDHVLGAGSQAGILVHYSETHDNTRLAAQGRAWSAVRNALCALASTHGAFGITCGVEWLADERLEVHQSRGMRWGAAEHLVDRIAALNRLVADHPCWRDGAQVARLSADDAAVVALARRSADAEAACLCLVNLDLTRKATCVLPRSVFQELGSPSTDLISDQAVAVMLHEGVVSITVAPGGAHVLAPSTSVPGLDGPAYRRARAQAAAAVASLAAVLPPEGIGPADWRDLAARWDADPLAWTGAVARIDAALAGTDLLRALDAVPAGPPPVVVVHAADARRVVPVPAGQWVVVLASDAGVMDLGPDETPERRWHLVPWRGGWAVVLPPTTPGRRRLRIACPGRATWMVTLRDLPVQSAASPAPAQPGSMALLANGRGAMSRLQADLGGIASKYDCLLAANLHPSVPCDRHVLVKRLRAWGVAGGFVTPLQAPATTAWDPGPPATWTCRVHAGDGRYALVQIRIALVRGSDAVAISVRRLAPDPDHDLPLAEPVRVTMRLDLEDRSFHGETGRSHTVETAWLAATSTLADGPGFRFAPAADRVMTVLAQGEGARWHPSSEWSTAIPHPVEVDRGMAGAGDAWSPGWFDLSADGDGSSLRVVVGALRPLPELPPVPPCGVPPHWLTALDAYLVRRDEGWTVIAGYPWFLDWGRDTCIAARGLVAAGRAEVVAGILATFARFIAGGTMPNILAGEEAGNRDTSDAPLWFAIAAEECAAVVPDLWHRPLRQRPGGPRTIAEAVAAIASGYLTGTANGIRCDRVSGLVWSPPHFTWMDTNHPAATPRTGYPIEIQALWIRVLRCCARLGLPCADPAGWSGLAERATGSLARFWRSDLGWYADLLPAAAGSSPHDPDDALRPNQLIAIALGVLRGEPARRAVAACQRHLVVLGAVRSLAPLPVDTPVPVIGAHGQALVDPHQPYQGSYAGDEDTRRKPAYHNGTAWVWLLPVFAEALVRAWDGHPAAVAAARSHLAGLDDLLPVGCAGHLPEILDGDAPHRQRGCDAQAWSLSEAVRVARLLADPGALRASAGD
jgi:starch synthase (maltosyl-transferring)